VGERYWFCRTDGPIIAGTQFRIGCRPIGACTPLQTSVRHAALAKQLPNQTGWLKPAEAPAMTKSAFEKLAAEVLFHEDHKPRPDIQYEGLKPLS